MLALLKSEFIQLTTTRTALWWAIAVLFLVDFEGPSAPGSGISLFALLFSIVAVTGSYRHKVAVTEQLVAPGIWQSTVAKLIVFGLVCALFVCFQTAIVTGIIKAFDASNFEIGPKDLHKIGLATLGAGISGMLGVAIARLVRGQVAAILATAAYFLIAEPTFASNIFRMNANLHKQIIAYLPGTAFTDIVQVEHSTLFAVGVLAGWVTLLSLAAYLLDRKRDWK